MTWWWRQEDQAWTAWESGDSGWTDSSSRWQWQADDHAANHAADDHADHAANHAANHADASSWSSSSWPRWEESEGMRWQEEEEAKEETTSLMSACSTSTSATSLWVRIQNDKQLRSIQSLQTCIAELAAEVKALKAKQTQSSVAEAKPPPPARPMSVQTGLSVDPPTSPPPGAPLVPPLPPGAPLSGQLLPPPPPPPGAPPVAPPVAPGFPGASPFSVVPVPGELQMGRPCCHWHGPRRGQALSLQGCVPYLG